MNKQNFREQDIESAIKEHSCIDTLQNQLANHIERGSYAAAQICLEDIKKSLDSLCKMRHTKREHDRLIETAKRLQKSGINLMVVERCVR